VNTLVVSTTTLDVVVVVVVVVVDVKFIVSVLTNHTKVQIIFSFSSQCVRFL
jgi:hypothetical protein